ncbi:hypothetical protein PC9H_004408 [Pleurotus ostreatus]|uniref:Uncharacterized protein n=3 Tax=Pleurotus TaxID=5320 RepID=A0A067NPG0_PLEO1|nr:uncharacterized protein PC9H_004408 [Pleurotus ostreatus]KAF7437566.1 hypothetical protein PC9H_004408 [Pleurotus ostreatus]KAG9223394.1 hypothetical protein CCMSSC00406_0007581 [Pleurotus cornucopiae]KDQ29958.1 hypothetical protein PLEOSDRAFT_154682 [Pleurotus ostreatus PC15]
MAKSLLGKFVLAIPTRTAFAISSGSWTGLPANKVRPCLVTGFTESNQAILAPLCGAVYDKKRDTWDPRERMLGDHWMPVNFKDSGVIIPPLNSSFDPPTLKVAINAANLTAGDPPFKPCYLWVADLGEEISIEDLLLLKQHKALEGISKADLQVIRDLGQRISASKKKAQPAVHIKATPL